MRLLASQLSRGARAPISQARCRRMDHGSRKFLLVELETQLRNAKTAIAYASIFTALLPAADPPGWVAYPDDDVGDEVKSVAAHDLACEPAASAPMTSRMRKDCGGRAITIGWPS
jgi:hypothetical protein